MNPQVVKELLENNEINTLRRLLLNKMKEEVTQSMQQEFTKAQRSQAITRYCNDTVFSAIAAPKVPFYIRDEMYVCNGYSGIRLYEDFRELRTVDSTITLDDIIDNTKQSTLQLVMIDIEAIRTAVKAFYIEHKSDKSTRLCVAVNDQLLNVVQLLPCLDIVGNDAQVYVQINTSHPKWYFKGKYGEGVIVYYSSSCVHHRLDLLYPELFKNNG